MSSTTPSKLVPLVFDGIFEEMPTEYKMLIRGSLPNIAIKQFIANLEREYERRLQSLDVSLAAEDFQMQYVAAKQMQLCMKMFLQFVTKLGETK